MLGDSLARLLFTLIIVTLMLRALKLRGKES